MHRLLLAFSIVFGLSQCAAASDTDDPASVLGVSSVELEYSVLREVAKGGDPVIQLEAFLHVNENLPALQPHVQEALGLLEQSAESGFSKAQYMLGFIQVRGKMVDKQIESGLVWLEKAADAGHERASLWIGITHVGLFHKESNARKEKKHFRNAERWLEKTIADQDGPTPISLAAMSTLGQLYVANDVHDPKGLDILFEATELGSPQALRTLEKLKTVLIENVEKGFDTAVPILERVSRYLDNVQTD